MRGRVLASGFDPVEHQGDEGPGGVGARRVRGVVRCKEVDPLTPDVDGGGYNNPGAHCRSEGQDVLDPVAKPGSSGVDHVRRETLKVAKERGEGGPGW